MATQNVCRYFKFGHCKFNDKCRLLHVKEECENQACEIINCSLRHPRPCNYFRDYSRCKFSDYCSYKHVEKQNSSSKCDNKEIMEKLDSLTKTIYEKDDIIKELAEKVKILEEKVIAVYDTVDENDAENCVTAKSKCEENDDINKNLVDKFNLIETKLGNIIKMYLKSLLPSVLLKI